MSRSRIYNKIPKRFIHGRVGLTSKSLRTNTAASLGGMHVCSTRTSATASAPSAVGFDNYDYGVKHFKLPVPEYFNFASDVVDLWAEKEASIIGRIWHFPVWLCAVQCSFLNNIKLLTQHLSITFMLII